MAVNPWYPRIREVVVQAARLVKTDEGKNNVLYCGEFIPLLDSLLSILRQTSSVQDKEAALTTVLAYARVAEEALGLIIKYRAIEDGTQLRETLNDFAHVVDCEFMPQVQRKLLPDEWARLQHSVARVFAVRSSLP